jgi:uridine kinase
VLIAVATPLIHIIWFGPFLSHVLDGRGIDLWSTSLASGGDVPAFPYGAVFVVAYAPGVLLGQMLLGGGGALAGIILTTLLLDLAVLVALRSLIEDKRKSILMLLYWLSPITLYIGYWHGQLDVFPAFLLILSFVDLRNSRFARSGFVLGLAIAAKFSMAAAVPFVLLHIFGVQKLRSKVTPFLAGMVGAVAIFLLPLFALEGFRSMVLGTPELQKSIAVAIPYSPGLSLFAMPMAYAGLVLLAWRVRNFSFSELTSMVGVAFMLLYMLTPASPGWAMWFTPFLVLHTAITGWRAAILYVSLCGAFLAFHLLTSSGAYINLGVAFDLTQPLEKYMPVSAASWVFSAMAVAAFALMLQIVRERLLRDGYYLSTRKPVLIGIAGDSGAGKDTLSDLIVDMFGRTSVAKLSGDDYHLWDRQKPMWRALTHLDPKANDLDRFARDATLLANRRPVETPHYDHAVGRMTKPLRVQPADMVVVSGLHALLPPSLTNRYDLRIFLDMDEKLRRFLKIKRDVTVRGHALGKVLDSIEARTRDGDRHIRPQIERADLVIRLEAARPSDLNDYSRPIEDVTLRLRVSSAGVEDFDTLERLLVSVCGMHVIERRTGGTLELLIEGEPLQQDVVLTARMLAPAMVDHLSLDPVWRGGQNGLLQLVVLDQLNRVRAQREHLR